MDKKLQVFVSSTYTDLIEERQAAVEAILDAGHIPAGMELFKAGNNSQLKTIYKWIDDSDVYMLILGGRYGSIESKSGKSYTQLEYEYALSRSMPVFAVILSDLFLTNKINLIGLKDATEKFYPNEYKLFKSTVMTKVIRHVDDCKDIKIVIHSTLNEFMNEYNLSGWIRNTPENDTMQLIKDNNTLMKDNLALNKQIAKLEKLLESQNREVFGNYTYKELVGAFKQKTFSIPSKFFSKSTHDEDINALLIFTINYSKFCTGISNTMDMSELDNHLFYNVCPYFIAFGLLEKVKLAGTRAQRIQISKTGGEFYAMLELKGDIII